MEYEIIKETLFFSTIVTVLVWLNTPVIVYNESQKKYQSVKILIRSFFVAFIVIFIYLYLTHDDKCGDDVLQNMIKSEPDF